MLNITDKDWSEEDELEAFLLFDQFIYTDNEEVYNKYFRNKTFCDTSGELYKVIGKTPPASMWRNVLKFLPNVYKVTLGLQRTKQKMEIEELRQFVLNRLNEIKQDDFVAKWIEQIKQAKNHKEIIDGQVK